MIGQFPSIRQAPPAGRLPSLPVRELVRLIALVRCGDVPRSAWDAAGFPDLATLRVGVRRRKYATGETGR